MFTNGTCLWRLGDSTIVHCNRNIRTACPDTSQALWIHPGALTNQRCSLAIGCVINSNIIWATSRLTSLATRLLVPALLLLDNKEIPKLHLLSVSYGYSSMTSEFSPQRLGKSSFHGMASFYSLLFLSYGFTEIAFLISVLGTIIFHGRRKTPSASRETSYVDGTPTS